jgi:hypothetical protein
MIPHAASQRAAPELAIRIWQALITAEYGAAIDYFNRLSV